MVSLYELEGLGFKGRRFVLRVLGFEVRFRVEGFRSAGV